MNDPTDAGNGTAGTQPRLERRLGLGDAVVLGLGAMLGAGVFASFSPAAKAAGAGLLLALAVAGVVAYCNAMSSAQLAARYPESGGTYVYARRRLSPAFGFCAGWVFITGKIASCAAMALTVGSYAWPEHPKLVALGAVAALTVVDYLGVQKTARMTRLLVSVTVLALAAVVVAALGGGQADIDNLRPVLSGGPLGILQAAGFLFFAFAGYARIATLGEEVRDPERTIPRAVPVALGIVLLVYAVVAVSALLAVGPDRLATATAPLAAAAGAGSLDWMSGVVRFGGAFASMGVLLSLLAGIGRTTLAMSRDRELPHWFANIHGRFHVPDRAILGVGGLVMVIVAATDVRGAIGFSSVNVLLYYALANVSAITLAGRSRRWLRPVAAVGLAGCLVLAVSLPLSSVLAGVAVAVVGLVGRALVRGGRRRTAG